MGIRTNNNLKLNLKNNSFTDAILRKLYVNGLPDYSEKENMTNEDLIIEKAFSIAASDGFRSTLMPSDIEEAINEIQLSSEALEEFTVKSFSNIKVVKKTPVQKTNIIVQTNNEEEKTQVNSKNTKNNSNSQSFFTPDVINAIEQMAGINNASSIIDELDDDTTKTTKIFVGHNTTNGSDKYYILANRDDGTSVAYWARVGSYPSAKVYGVNEKSYSVLRKEKGKKGYNTIIEK